MWHEKFVLNNLHIIYLTLSYILQIHSSKNTYTYFSYIFKLHVLHSIHIQDPCLIKYLHIIPIYITNTISHNIYIYTFLPSLHILKHIKHPSKNLLLKTLLMKDKNLLLKALLMEGNITHTWLKNQKSITWGKSFKCMIKRINLTNLCTQLDIFSLTPVASIFPLQSWSHHERTHFIMLLKCHKSTAILRLELQNMKISHYIFVFKFILLSIFYSLSLYHSTNVIMPLDSFSHVAEMSSPLMLYGWSYKIWRLLAH